MSGGAARPYELIEVPEESKKIGLPIVDTPHSITSNDTTVSYLRGDLLKIFFLSSLAIAIQLSLYFALKVNLIRLHF